MPTRRPARLSQHVHAARARSAALGTDGPFSLARPVSICLPCSLSPYHPLSFCSLFSLSLSLSASLFTDHLTINLSHSLVCRLLATHEEELRRILGLLAADGAVGAQVTAKRTAVRSREQELRALEGTRAELEQRMRAFSGESVVSQSLSLALCLSLSLARARARCLSLSLSLSLSPSLPPSLSLSLSLYLPPSLSPSLPPSLPLALLCPAGVPPAARPPHPLIRNPTGTLPRGAGKGGGVMLKLDELSGEVAGLAALRSSLAMLERMRKLEAAFFQTSYIQLLYTGNTPGH